MRSSSSRTSAKGGGFGIAGAIGMRRAFQMCLEDFLDDQDMVERVRDIAEERGPRFDDFGIREFCDASQYHLIRPGHVTVWASVWHDRTPLSFGFYFRAA